MRSILIVDDEATILKGLAVMTQNYDASLTVHTAANGAEALERIRREPPDVLLTDIRMPRMDGLSLCEAVHNMDEPIAVAVISGYGDFGYAQKCLSFGVKEYLLKPVTEAELYPVLGKLLSESPRVPFSISQYEEWLERTETAIWGPSDGQELHDLLSEWTVMTNLLPKDQLRVLVHDILSLLVKRLNARHVFEFELAADASDREMSAAELQHFFETALFELAAELALKRGGSQKNVPDEMMAYIDRNLAGEITLDEVAERIGLTPSYLSSLFKKTTQMSFVQYKTKKRIEMAKRLLELPHYRVTDVAAEVGYESYPHFVRIFKSLTGCTPSEYRSRMGIK
ncbi:response regulator [Paenibacillus hamazuiensis]|uniref:response regulator n=1 Tax=Paenibacillus hamazuiensis TaxID=2936508 RepID=UPI00201034A2|nr:response regulator [Paenibacillus hamazuiensis]